MTNTFFENRSLVDLFFTKPLLNKGLVSFKNKLKEYEHLNGLKDSEKISHLNLEVFGLLSELSIDKLFVSITQNQSLYYRFSFPNQTLEFKWEVFFEKLEDAEINIDSIVHVFEKSENKCSFFGPISEMFEVIKSESKVPFTLYAREFFSTNNFVFKQFPAELAIPSLVNSQKELSGDNIDWPKYQF